MRTINKSAKCVGCGNDIHEVTDQVRTNWLHIDGMDRFAHIGLHTAVPKRGTIKEI